MQILVFTVKNIVWLLEKTGVQRPSLSKVLAYEAKLYNESNNQEFYKMISSNEIDKIKLLIPEHPTKEDALSVINLFAKQDSQFASKLRSIKMENAMLQHNFWLKYTTELDLKYDTNYSYLK